MIRDSIENLKKYECLFPVIPQVLEFFKQENISDGIHNICDGCFVNVQTFNTKQEDEILYELHKDYADIQVILEGKERQFWNKVSNLKIKKEYEPDVALYVSDARKYLEDIMLEVGDFVIYFPGEAHAPGYSQKESTKCKRAIVKIKM